MSNQLRCTIMEEKISVAEISRLREAAEEERKHHRSVMKEIEQQKSGEKVMSPEEQMEIITRGNKTEIKAMLEAFGMKSPLSSKVQLYIYYHSLKEDKIREWMLENCLLSFELEQLLIDNNLQIQRKLSPQAEMYMLQQKLNKSRNWALGYYMDEVEKYLDKYELSPEGQSTLMSYLNIGYGRDSLIDKCEKIVKDYIGKYKQLTIDAQRLLIKSGNHVAIMSYIREALKGLEAEDELLERGDRKEVEAYFARYATM